MKTSVECRVSSVEMCAANAACPRHASGITRHPSPVTRHAFTLLELLVVIAILGLLAGLTVPVLRNFSKSDATISGSRQLVDGLARARQMAMSQRTTVYMVFIPTNFWVDTTGTFPNNSANSWWKNLPDNLKTTVTNLADKQLSGFNFVAKGAMGDQPGQHAWHYLDRWQGLPEGTYISWQKFTNPPPTKPVNEPSYVITDPIYPSKFYQIFAFNTATNIPFPSEKGTNSYTARIVLPYVAFNYLGQLTFDGQTMADRDEHIPLSQGSVLPLTAPGTKALQLLGPPAVFGTPDVKEDPPGNSTNISYNIIHIDRLTGRAVLEYHKMAP
jgi:prepilin-type N-terminal cleavage/methylation domain-containing protein